MAAVIEQRPDPREADQHWRLQLAPMERPIPFRDRRFRGTSEAKKSSTSKPRQHHSTHENFMGGISAIFGLGRRQQEKVTAAALERCETPQRFIVTAVQDRLEQDGLMVKITSDC